MSDYMDWWASDSERREKILAARRKRYEEDAEHRADKQKRSRERARPGC